MVVGAIALDNDSARGIVMKARLADDGLRQRRIASERLGDDGLRFGGR